MLVPFGLSLPLRPPGRGRAGSAPAPPGSIRAGRPRSAISRESQRFLCLISIRRALLRLPDHERSQQWPPNSRHPPALTPEQLQSVRGALRSPRRLKTEVLAGLVVALALIPEAIAFSIIAGVDPRIGLFASFTMAVTIAFLGGRPAMISAATGAVALVIAPLVKSHGLDYLVATVILAGVFQIVLGLFGVAKLMRFIPRSVMVGFVNALAILIFLSQVPELIGVPWLVYPLVALGLLIVFACRS